MIVLDLWAKIETPDLGALDQVRAIVDGSASRLYAFAIGPRLVLDIPIILGDNSSSLPLRGNMIVLTALDNSTYRVIALRGGCGCGGWGALRGAPVDSLLALVPA